MGVHFSPEDELTMQFKKTFMLYIYIYRVSRETARSHDSEGRWQAAKPDNIAGDNEKNEKATKRPHEDTLSNFLWFFTLSRLLHH